MFGYRIVGCFFLIRITIDLVRGEIIYILCFIFASLMPTNYLLLIP